jgi:hypothetical protein
MARILITTTTALSLLLGLVVPAMAAGNPQRTGQPNQSCEDQTSRPGQAINAPGSAFNPNGTAGSHYAGEQPQNSKNGQASQYDVACTQVSTHHP